MILLQAAIAGGIYLLVLIALAFLVGVPVLTILISSYLSRRDKRITEIAVPSEPEHQKPKSPGNNFFRGCIISIVIMVFFVLLAIILLDALIPNLE